MRAPVDGAHTSKRLPDCAGPTLPSISRPHSRSSSSATRFSLSSSVPPSTVTSSSSKYLADYRFLLQCGQPIERVADLARPHLSTGVADRSGRHDRYVRVHTVEGQ